MAMEWLVPGTKKRPSSNFTSPASQSKAMAAMRRPLAIRSSAAIDITVPAWRMERPECEPPPAFTTSVSPRMMLTVATGTPSRSATTWEKLVSWPWPEGWVPITTLTAPSPVTDMSARSRGEPIEDST